MNVLLCGGCIKYCEYYQCGKGCDLGFGFIFNFMIKIGMGMGEQFLFCEYYYFGIQLLLDCFLFFYYVYFGFYVNNMFIMFLVQFFMICFLQIGVF